MPYDLAGLNSLSALAYLAADTIFIDLVIFWTLVTDFRRSETERIKKVHLYQKHLMSINKYFLKVSYNFTLVVNKK